MNGVRQLTYQRNPSSRNDRSWWMLEYIDPDGKKLGRVKADRLVQRDDDGTVTALFRRGIRTTPADVSPAAWQERLAMLQ